MTLDDSMVTLFDRRSIGFVSDINVRQESAIPSEMTLDTVKAVVAGVLPGSWNRADKFSHCRVCRSTDMHRSKRIGPSSESQRACSQQHEHVGR